MSDPGAVFVAAALACVLLGVYGFALGRYEVGRKVPSLFQQTKVRWPYRRNRFPMWLLIVQWVGASLVVAPIFVVISSNGHSDEEFRLQMRTVIAIAAIAIAMLAGQLAIAYLHNRRSASYPPSGWYFAPDDPDNMRWWNGVEWLEYTFPKDRVAPDPYAPTTAE